MPGRLILIYFLVTAIRLFAQQSAGSSQVECVLAGTAVDFASGQPIRKARIELVPSTRNAPGQIAITDASGHFQITGIPEGTYELTGEAAGYLKSELGARQPGGDGTPVRLKAGDKLTGITLKLARWSVISGKVIDENGEPVPSAVIHAVSRHWLYGQPCFESEETFTDDAGEYRMINLSPGSYYLYADSASKSFIERQGGQEKRLLLSFYPGSGTVDGAQLLEVQAGQDLPGTNFQLHPEPVFHIRGKLAGRTLQDV